MTDKPSTPPVTPTPVNTPAPATAPAQNKPASDHKS
jgi:hypothetical protein